LLEAGDYLLFEGCMNSGAFLAAFVRISEIRGGHLQIREQKILFLPKTQILF